MFVTGQDKGKTGRVLHVDTNNDKVIIEGINMKQKHQRPTQSNPKGGIISIEGPIHLSNIALYSTTLSGPTRTAMRILADSSKKRRVRICRKTGEEI